ncbi:chemotaxis protein CheW [Jannaschia seohaensis]|uniref:Purine-binding chemotaxis protein CheW n=1 Tax=Jannaschia seohaensis TaxID=475081 RepID=A0A2Y9AZ41_9RHOB|nr:chemotaxis protein CheW [Jannaschia seohaensis]PWJ15856.1 purine-binding chemotaxis protein CheW [Jannaschia seohaensis]SSA49560.1 purine-binding chemotaxis protein CheW [Jannaschia seohaensis]
MTAAPLASQITSDAPPYGAGMELLTFRCGGRAFAVDIMAVREIRSWSAPTPLPHAPPYMRGMVNLRGSVLPVMDLAMRLGAPRTEDNPRNVIIVIQQGSRVHGLLVEAVSDIVHPVPDQLQDVPKVASEDETGMAERLFVVDDAMVQILSMERVLPRLPGMAEEGVQ